MMFSMVGEQEEVVPGVVHDVVHTDESLSSSIVFWKTTIMLVIICWVILYTYEAIKPFHVPTSVPGPPRYPLIGFLPWMSKNWDNLPIEAYKLSETCGGTWGGPLPNFGGVVGAYFFISDEENVRHVLQTKFENYGKGKWSLVLGELVGHGIFSADGATWVLHRKVMSHMFSRNMLRHSAQIMNEKINDLMHYFNEQIRRIDDDDDDDYHDTARTMLDTAKDDKPPSKPTATAAVVDIQDCFFRLTMDATCKIIFDVDLDSVKKGEQHPFAKAFDELQFNLCRRFQDPFFVFTKPLALTSRERTIRRCKGIVDNFAMNAIVNKRRRVFNSSDNTTKSSSTNTDKEEPVKESLDLISRFLNHAKNHKEDDVDDEVLRDVVMNTILAGRDTTACALSWLIYELTKHPDVVDKIIDEVERVCGREGDDTSMDVSYDTLVKLKYSNAVVLEVLRLHPSVPSDCKYAHYDDVLPDGTPIPAGSGIIYMQYAMGRSKRIWGNDVLQFKPERFLDTMEPSPYKYTVFNAGPRLCLGKQMALVSMKLAMARLLPKYKFRDIIGHSGECTWTLVHQMKGSFLVEVTKR